MTRKRQEEAGEQPWLDFHYSARDGLRLYGRRYPAHRAGGRPALCLAGLTRNADDFHVLASHLSSRPERPRDVYCLDYRGRGRSEHDPHWQNYTPYLELLDVLDFMTLAGLHDAALIGTSRGGIITMLMAAVRPGAVGAAVLNDVGPELQTSGLARIVGYVGRTPLPATWEEATAIVKRMHGHLFPALGDEDWAEFARLTYLEEDGRPAPSYDPRLARTLSQLDLARSLPDMWPQFTALARVPVMVVRGEYSDVLSKECLEAMQQRHPQLTRLEIEGQGHAPLLRDSETLEAIGRFLHSADVTADRRR